LARSLQLSISPLRPKRSSTQSRKAPLRFTLHQIQSTRSNSSTTLPLGKHTFVYCLAFRSAARSRTFLHIFGISHLPTRFLNKISRLFKIHSSVPNHPISTADSHGKISSPMPGINLPKLRIRKEPTPPHFHRLIHDKNYSPTFPFSVLLKINKHWKAYLKIVN